MTDEEAIALGKRVVACKGFRPMRGMLDMQGRTWDSSLLWRWHNEVDVPDLRDPATLGCLLALVREAWDDPQAFVGWFDPHWKVIRCRTESLIGFLAGRGATEAEALVAAWEAAP